MKLGTRCECRDSSGHCRGVHAYSTVSRDCRCTSDAVRLVTVACLPSEKRIAAVLEHGDTLPMCEPCAAHAEGGAK